MTIESPRVPSTDDVAWAPLDMDLSPYVNKDGSLTARGESTIIIAFAALAEAAWTNSELHGFHESDRPYSEEIALFHSEVAESFEEDRAGRDPLWFKGKDGAVETEPYNEAGEILKAEGMATELGDAVIRFADSCKARKWNLGVAIVLKHRYNLTRPFMHGKKC